MIRAIFTGLRRRRLPERLLKLLVTGLLLLFCQQFGLAATASDEAVDVDISMRGFLQQQQVLQRRVATLEQERDQLLAKLRQAREQQGSELAASTVQLNAARELASDLRARLDESIQQPGCTAAAAVANTEIGSAEDCQISINRLEGRVSAQNARLAVVNQKLQRGQAGVDAQSTQGSEYLRRYLTSRLLNANNRVTELEVQLKAFQGVIEQGLTTEVISRPRDAPRIAEPTAEPTPSGVDGATRSVRADGSMSLRTSGEKMFRTGSTRLSASGRAILDQISELLAANSTHRLQVEGHTDNVPIGPAMSGLYGSNWNLSVARALVAVRYLQDQRGIDPQRLSAAGYGQHMPIADNATASGRALNRRLEFVLRSKVPVQ